jgi:FixJ family two-component response regulator
MIFRDKKQGYREDASRAGQILRRLDRSAGEEIAPLSSAQSADAGEAVRVVVVDDDRDFVERLVQFLTKNGYEARGFAEAQEASQFLHRHREVELVVTDIMLPGISGLDLLGGLRAARRSIGMVVMSGFADGIEEAKVAKLGATFLQKPFRLASFLSAVEGELQS